MKFKIELKGYFMFQVQLIKKLKDFKTTQN